MKKGEIVERGTVHEIFENAQHPYTKGLLACRPSLNQHLKRLPTIEGFEKGEAADYLVDAKEVADRKAQLYTSDPILTIKKLSTWYPAKKNFFGKVTDYVKAVNEVSFEVFKGETFGLSLIHI